MRLKRILVAAATLSVITVGTVNAPAIAAEASGPVVVDSVNQQVKAPKVVKKSLRRMIASLPKKAEKRAGYQRSKFNHWVDADGDCQDTRSEVLRKESKRRVTGSCRVNSGRWVSMYDGRVFKQASKLDVDHMVPLAEAWDSGARKWSADTRKRFANDLRDPRSLIAVSASSNRSKSDRDPGEWLPERKVCTYITHWTAVKVRWSLSVSPREKRVLKRTAKSCANKTVKVKKAYISTKAATAPKPKPKPRPPSGTDPQYGTCAEAKRNGYGPYYRGTDPEYDWYRDADSDGIVCE